MTAIDDAGKTIIISCADQGVDINGDSIWDFLKCTIGLDVNVAGTYVIVGKIASNGDFITNRASVKNSVPIEHMISLSQGVSQTDIHFSGEDIYRSGVDGPYTIHLVLYDTNGNQIDQKDFSSAAYKHDSFGEYPAKFTNVPDFTTPDENGDGLYDFLSASVKVQTGVAGKYMVQGQLYGGDTLISTAHISQDLPAGIREIILQFRGEIIHTSGIDGPFTLHLMLYDKESLIDSQKHDTIAYDHNDFSDPPVELQNFNDFGADSNLNGLYESLTLVSGMNVYRADTYQITAWLENQNGVDITYATMTIDLSQGPQQITLEFPGEAIYESGIDGPYLVAHVRVVNTEGRLAASKYNAHETQFYGYTDFEAPVPPLVIATGNYTDAGVDTNGNGLFDFLNIGVEVLASDSGVIIVSGRLIDNTGEEIAYTSMFDNVTAGIPKFINLNFDGRYIFGNLHDGPYNLKSLLVYHTGDPTQANWVQDAFTTDFYAYDTFEPCAAITGFVKNETNDPISNVMLSLGSTDFDFTNSQGIYHLVSLTGATYNISMSDITGYPPYSWEIFVNGNMIGYGNSVDVNVGVGDILQVDFKQPTNQPPLAVCENQMVIADENCQGDASIDGGSFDPNGDPMSQSFQKS